MSNELLKESWKELAFPLLDKYFQDVWEKRTKENSWPARSIFSDLCKPFKVEDKKSGVTSIRLMCVVPPTPSFWSAILAMYVLFGRETFKSHQRACLIFLDEVNNAKFHVAGVTDQFHILKWLQTCAEAKGERNDKNIFIQDPAWCCSLLQNDLMIVQGTKSEKDFLNVDKGLLDHFRGKFQEISKRLQGKENDGQGQGVGEHSVEGERGSGPGDGNGILGGASDGPLEVGPDVVQLPLTEDIRSSNSDLVYRERVEGLVSRHEPGGSDGRDSLYCSSI